MPCAIGIAGVIYSTKFLQSRGMAWIAAIAYELYIIHGYTIRYLHNWNSGLVNAVWFLLTTFIFALALHCLLKFINKPLYKIMKIQ